LKKPSPAPPLASPVKCAAAASTVATISRPAAGDGKFPATEFGGRCLFKSMSEQNKINSRAKTAKATFLLVLIGILVATAIPNFLKPIDHDSAIECINRLRQIDAAAIQFALEAHLTNGEAIHFPNDLTPYFKLNDQGKIPPCPAGGHHSISRVGEAPTCSLGTTVTPNHVLP
jgi:hypothetical protein